MEDARRESGRFDVALVIPEEPVENSLNGDFLHDGRFFGCDEMSICRNMAKW